MSNFTPSKFVTRTGRVVWAGGDDGTLYTPSTKDYEGNPRTVKNGPDAGKPAHRHEFGLAIAKQPGETHWGQTPEGAIIWAQGHKDHPGSASRPDFAWKVTDGDSQIPGKAKNGKPGRKPCDKEGFAGHWVFTFSSAFPIKFVNSDGSAYLLEPNAVKVGDYVQVAANVVGNTGATPGVYLNHDCVALQGYGAPITNGPDPSTLGFGKGPAPAGMSTVPVGAMTAPPVPAAAAPAAPAPLPAAALPSAPLPSPTPPAPAAAAPAPLPTPTPTPPPAPVAVAPNPAILGTAPPAPAPAPPAPPTPTAPQMTAKAQYTYDQYKASGWTDDMLRAHALMV
jgi:hypothetical protein